MRLFVLLLSVFGSPIFEPHLDARLGQVDLVGCVFADEDVRVLRRAEQLLEDV